MKRIARLLILSSLFMACTKEDDTVKINKEILGDYQFISYTSHIPLDLDLDNVKDTNLLNEFDRFYNKSNRDAKVWEYCCSLNREPFYYYISLINFPRVFTSSKILSQNQDSVYFNIDSNTVVTDFKNVMTDYPEEGKYFLTRSFEILPNKNLRVTGVQQFYDYQNNEWIEVGIEAILEKK